MEALVWSVKKLNRAVKTRHEVKKPELLNTGSKEVKDMRDV